MGLQVHGSPLLFPPTHTHWDIHWLAGAWAGRLSTSKAEISPLGCPRHKEVSVQRSSRWEESPPRTYRGVWRILTNGVLTSTERAQRGHQIGLQFQTRLCQSLGWSFTSFYKSTVFQWGLYPAVHLLCSEENEHRFTVKRRREGNHPLHQSQRERAQELTGNTHL